MKDQLISILTPAWKAAPYIEATINSVRAQTYPHWEMMIVDDCSPDNTAEIVTAVAKDDPRIRFIRHVENKGPAAARNTALAQAHGRWVAMLDSDDRWLPEKLQHQLDFQRAHDAKLTYTSFRRTNEEGNEEGHRVAIPSSLTYRELLANTAIATSTVMIDRVRAGTFCFKKMYYDDLGCWLDLLRDGSIAHGLDEDLMRYRVIGQSVSRNKWNSAQQVWKTYREVESLGRAQAALYFTQYAVNALRKYRTF